MRRLVWLVMERSLKGFLGSGRIGAAFRRGLILGLALNPSKDGGFEHFAPPAEQDDEKAAEISTCTCES